MTSRTVHYIGGPLDGQTLDVSDWTDDQIGTGVYQIVDGWEARADYEPDADANPLRWHYRGPVQN